MQQKTWLILFAILSSCATGPKVTVCVSDPPLGLECYDEREQRKFIIPYEKSKKFVAMPAEDAHTIFNYCEQSHEGGN